jgi:hypothetical protein
MNFTKIKKSMVVLALALVILILLVLSTGIIYSVHAATITPISDTMTLQTVSVSATNNFSFDAVSGIPASGTVTITFPSGFTSVSTSSATSSMSGATFGVSGNVVTVTNGTTAVTAGTTVTISGITAVNPSTASSTSTQYIITVSDSGGDQASIAVAIVTSSQVAISATVNPTITFSISSNSIGFGVLTATAVSSQTNTLTLSTNASDGANITVYDLNAGLLQNVTSGHLIASATATLAAGTEGYGINGTGGGGLATVSPYNGTGDAVGALQKSAQSLASISTPVSGGTVTVNYLAAISAVTPAGTYADTVTFIATGNF